MAISGEWNYQGGEDRSAFVNEFPLQTAGSGFDVGVEKETNEALTDIIFDRRVFGTNLAHNLGYFFVGRYSGLLPYFFPALFALAAFVVGIRRRPAWQYFVVAAVLGQMLTFIIGTPYTWHGGGGSVGNRYFMSAYGLLLFVMPVLPRSWMAFVPWVVGALFTAPLVLNPFYASFYPGSYAQARAAALAAGRADARLRLADQHRQLARPRVVRRSRGPQGPRLPDLLLRRQRVSAGRRQDLLGQGRVAGGVPDQDRSRRCRRPS